MELLLIRKDSCVNAYAELTQDLESIISAVSLDDCSVLYTSLLLMPLGLFTYTTLFVIRANT